MILDNACPTLQGLSIKSWTSRILLHFVILSLPLSLSSYISIASLSFLSPSISFNFPSQSHSILQALSNYTICHFFSLSLSLFLAQSLQSLSNL